MIEPLYLLALAAVALPIWAHLSRRRDLKQQPLPTLRLLRRAQARSRRRVQLIDLLLLLLRALSFAIGAVALAGPFVTMPLAYGDGAQMSLAVVIDDSMSMSRSEGGATLLAAAKERAAEAIGSLPEGSEVALVLAGERPRLLLSRTADRGRAAERLEALPDRSARGGDLSAAIALAQRELSSAPHARREILVLSDFTRSAGLDAARAARSGPILRYERIGERAPTANLAVVAARVAPDPTSPEAASIAVEVRAFGGAAEEVEVELLRGGRAVSSVEARLIRGGASLRLHAPWPGPDEDPSFLLRVRGAGGEGGEDALPADALPEDDSRAVLVRGAGGHQVLLVDGDPERRQSRFLARALDLAPEGRLRRRTVDPDTFSGMDLSGQDVVILADVRAPGRPLAGRLADFVRAGGGLLIAPGERFDARAYAAAFEDLLPARPRPPAAGELRGLRSPDPSRLAAEGLEHVRNDRRLLLEGGEGEPLLTFPDGAPALLLARRGEGAVALAAFGLDTGWGDLPFHPGFLPLAVALVELLAPPGRTANRPFAPGASVPLRAPAGAQRAQVVDPSGEAHELEAAALEEGIRFRETELPGAYRFQVATRRLAMHDAPRAAFVVAPPPEESDLSPGELPSQAQPDEARQESGGTIRRLLAPWLYLAFGLFLLLEGGLRLRSGEVKSTFQSDKSNK